MISDLSKYSEYIEEASSTYGVDKNLIKGVIQAESSGKVDAISYCGAEGLMQLMPATARSLGVTNSFDAKQNILGGTKYLAELIKTNNGDVNRALSAYNQGQGNLNKYGITNGTYVNNVLSYTNEFSNGSYVNSSGSGTSAGDKSHSNSTGSFDSNIDTISLNWLGDITVGLCCIGLVAIIIFFLVRAFNISASIKKIKKGVTDLV